MLSVAASIVLVVVAFAVSMLTTRFKRNTTN
jgi:hypothetical protein